MGTRMPALRRHDAPGVGLTNQPVRRTSCFVSAITPGFPEQYRLQKQHVPPRQTGEAIAVRST